jgi:PAS domain S-box-containing protein
MVAPIKGAQGVILGAIVGVVILDQANFLDRITANPYGKTGGYLIVAPRQRRVVAATDKRLVTATAPAAGAHSAIDRFIQGFEGSDVMVIPRGVETLVSVKRVPVAGWYVASVLPTAEAFAPVHDLQRRMALATVVLTLLAGGLTWWMLRRQLAPMQAAADALAAVSAADPFARPLPVTTQDEIGQLVGGFNNLLAAVHTREQALQRNQVMLARTEGIAHVGSWAWTVATDTVTWSDEMFRIFQRDPAQGAPSFADHAVLYLPQDMQRLRDVASACLSHGTPYELELHAVRGDGQTRVCLARGEAELDAEQRVTRLFGSLQDITDRQRLEEELRAEKAFAESLVDTAQVIILVLDTAGRIVRFNPYFEQLCGYTLAEVAGKSWVETFLPPDEQMRIRSLFEPAAKDLDAVGNVNAVVTRQGTHRAIEWYDKPLIDADGKALGLLAVGLDITDRRATEAELARHRLHLESLVQERTAALSIAKSVAETASRAKSTFLANMSHELRTPMNAIMGMTDLVMRQSDDAKVKERLGKVIQSSRHLLGVINDILDISKIEAERLTLEKVPLNVGTVLTRLVQMVSHRAEEKQLALRVDLARDAAGLPLLGDPLRLGQVLLNLVGNAIKFTARGSITVRVQLIEQTPTEALLRWEVADTGIGIAPEQQLGLFTAFEQGDGSMTRRYGGTGLGLAISKRLVQMMGGEIGVDSRPESGSTFWFTVRLAKAPGGSGVEPPEQPMGGDAALDRLRARHAGTAVLLAEDEPINQEVSRGLLEAAGLAVDLAEDGAVAVDMARRKPYALILMDMQMPRLNGVDATRAIRALAGYAQTPILAMTANAFDDDRLICIEAGMNEHISKPVDPGLMYASLLKWLSAPGGQAAENTGR